MLSTRTLARATVRIATKPQQQSRLTFQSRRFASEASKAAESAFVKEREAVKHHAAESSGSLFPNGANPLDNLLMNILELWRKISL